MSTSQMTTTDEKVAMAAQHQEVFEFGEAPKETHVVGTVKLIDHNHIVLVPSPTNDPNGTLLTLTPESQRYLSNVDQIQ